MDRQSALYRSPDRYTVQALLITGSQDLLFVSTSKEPVTDICCQEDQLESVVNNAVCPVFGSGSPYAG